MSNIDSSNFNIIENLQGKVKVTISLSCCSEINTVTLLNEAAVEDIFKKISSSSNYESIQANTEHQENWSNLCTIPNHEETEVKHSYFMKHLNHLIIKQQYEFQDHNKLFPAAVLLNKRVAITKAIIKNVRDNYHIVASKETTKKNGRERQKSEHSNDHEVSETEILLQLSVKTLMTFLFSLMRMSWSSADVNMRLVCSDVLQSCTSLLTTLPPLCLANVSKLPKLARSCLDDVTVFLAKLLHTPSDAISSDVKASALEIFLGLAILRGDIRFLLEWIEICIKLLLQGKAKDLKLENISHWLKILKCDVVSI